MPNTSIVKNTITTCLPNLPELPPNKSNAIVTKHFSNIILYLPIDQSALMFWLLYQMHADNTIIYSTVLLRRYCKIVYEANKHYNVKFSLKKPNGLMMSTLPIRRNFVALIQAGYLIRVNPEKIMINPMLTYYEWLSRKQYISIMAKYQLLSADNQKELSEFCIEYINLVKSKING